MIHKTVVFNVMLVIALGSCKDGFVPCKLVIALCSCQLLVVCGASSNLCSYISFDSFASSNVWFVKLSKPNMTSKSIFS